MGALLNSKDFGTRQTFNRKIVDFVILDTKLDVRLIIELDDSSHKYKREKDKKRDQMLQSAGYRTIRLSYVPSVECLQKQFRSMTCLETYSQNKETNNKIQMLHTIEEPGEDGKDIISLLASELNILGTPGIIIVAYKGSYVWKKKDVLNIRPPNELYYKYLSSPESQYFLHQACQNIGRNDVVLKIQKPKNISYTYR